MWKFASTYFQLIWAILKSDFLISTFGYCMYAQRANADGLGRFKVQIDVYWSIIHNIRESVLQLCDFPDFAVHMFPSEPLKCGDSTGPTCSSTARWHAFKDHFCTGHSPEQNSPISSLLCFTGFKDSILHTSTPSTCSASLNGVAIPAFYLHALSASSYLNSLVQMHASQNFFLSCVQQACTTTINEEEISCMPAGRLLKTKFNWRTINFQSSAFVRNWK